MVTAALDFLVTRMEHGDSNGAGYSVELVRADQFLSDDLSDSHRELLALGCHALRAAKLKFWHPGVDADVECGAPLSRGVAPCGGE